MGQIDVGYTNPDDAPEREMPVPFAEKNCLMQLTEADTPKTKDGNGTRLTYKAEVLEGQFKGRKVFGGINIIHPNDIAQKIGQAELAEVTKAVKLLTIPRDTAELLYRPFRGDVEIEAANTDKSGKIHPPKSVIKRYRLASGEDLPKREKVAGQQQSTSQAGGQQSIGKRPWES